MRWFCWTSSSATASYEKVRSVVAKVVKTFRLVLLVSPDETLHQLATSFRKPLELDSTFPQHICWMGTGDH